MYENMTTTARVCYVLSWLGVLAMFAVSGLALWIGLAGINTL